MNHGRAVCLVGFLCACASSPAAPAGSSEATAGEEAAAVAPEPAGPDDLLEELAVFGGEHALIGASARVWRDGEVVAQGDFGSRVVGYPLGAIGANDAWHLGSNTKAMTATLVALHVDRGALTWDATLSTLLPGVRMHRGYRDVTLEMLLQHRGGAPETPPRAVWSRAAGNRDTARARARFVADILGARPAQTPGEYAYSNAGYTIVGAVLEQVSGKSWETLMQEELFAPLGMTSCGFGPPSGDTRIPGDNMEAPVAIYGHDAEGNAVDAGPGADNPPAIGPAGTVHCSLADYGKFLALHAGASSAPRLLSDASLARLHTAPEGGTYAMGWTVGSGPRGPVLGHSGSNTMWYATAVVVPEARLAVVAATNRAVALEPLVAPWVDRYAAASP